MPELACPESTAEVGWEEAAEAGLIHLLSSRLARTAGEAAITPAPLAAAADTARLKKHVALVVARLAGREQAAAGGGGEVEGVAAQVGRLRVTAEPTTAGPAAAASDALQDVQEPGQEQGQELQHSQGQDQGQDVGGPAQDESPAAAV
jgi:hypothetical protein